MVIVIGKKVTENCVCDDVVNSWFHWDRCRGDRGNGMIIVVNLFE